MTDTTRPPERLRLRSLRLDVQWSDDDQCFVLTTEPDLGIGHVAFDFVCEAVSAASEEVEEQFEREDIERGVAECAIGTAYRQRLLDSTNPRIVWGDTPPVPTQMISTNEYI